jgi:hypothetical protein
MARGIIAVGTVAALVATWIVLWPVRTVSCMPARLLVLCPRPAGVVGLVVPAGPAATIAVSLAVIAVGTVLLVVASRRRVASTAARRRA